MKTKKKTATKRGSVLGANKYVMKIGRVSTHSYSMILPKEIIKLFKWKERQKLLILVDKDKQELRIKDWKKKK